ncbi:unnamed protein product [Prunus brigantina]
MHSKEMAPRAYDKKVLLSAQISRPGAPGRGDVPCKGIESA